MTEEKKVRMRVVSRLTEPDGDVHEIKNARSGMLRETADGIVLEYDDVQDEEKAHIILTMKPGRTQRENRARMQRRGMVSSMLTFLPGQKVSSSYVTIYGDIPVAVDTRSVGIEQDERGGELRLDYDVYMGGERTSSAVMEITWRL
ncbi:MAG: DUF1934 domain-containing protein [Clostridiales bacterium]|nr:DUF1934 domain-containing protein [Clostridiales bacterium]